MTTYAALTRETSQPLKALVHRRRLAQAARILGAGAEDRVLDYGCGDGHLFTHLLGRVPADRLVGYDPMLLAEMDPALKAQVRVYDDVGALLADWPRAFSVISCIEVCEHIDEAATETLFANLRALAAPGARIVVGVPMETGLSGLAKTLYRMRAGPAQGATVGKALAALVGAEIARPRDAQGLIPSHIGFREEHFARLLPRFGLRVERRDYLPFPWLRGALNNEVYFTCRVS